MKKWIAVIIGLLWALFTVLSSDTDSGQEAEDASDRNKCYSPEEWTIHEQEMSGESWHGVPLCELSRLAQTTYRGKYVDVDGSNFLVLHYTSKSGKTKIRAQYSLDGDGHLVMLPHGYYPGQWRDSADEFVEKANQEFSFI